MGTIVLLGLAKRLADEIRRQGFTARMTNQRRNGRRVYRVWKGPRRKS